MIDPFKSFWLSEVSGEAVEVLRSLAVAQHVQKPEVVHAFGRSQPSLWAVVSGQVRAMVSTNEMPPTLGTVYAPGAWFGELELVLSIDAFVQMEALADTTLIRLDGAEFSRHAAKLPDLWKAVAKLASLNFWFAAQVANDLVLRTSHKRIAATLLRLVGRRAAVQGNPPLEIAYANQQEVADLANVARTTASKILQEFQQSGLVHLDYGRITIRDPEALDQLLLQ